jgi:hypothetical protein
MFFITPPQAVTGAGSTSCARLAGHLLRCASIATSCAALYLVHHLLRQNRRRTSETLLFEKTWIRTHELHGGHEKFGKVDLLPVDCLFHL